MTQAAPSARPDTEVVFDPASYVGGVPFDALARLRRDQPVAWVAEPPVLGWPEGPGFWLVLRHADVESVLTRLRSFTPRAVSQLEDKIRGHTRAICDRVLAGPRGECDFAKDLAADLPLLTLADVLGLPEQDRRLLFDWSNRVIGYQDPDYAASAEFDPAEGTPMAAEALALRPAPDRDGRMPTPTCWPNTSGVIRVTT